MARFAVQTNSILIYDPRTLLYASQLSVYLVICHVNDLLILYHNLNHVLLI